MRKVKKIGFQSLVIYNVIALMFFASGLLSLVSYLPGSQESKDVQVSGELSSVGTAKPIASNAHPNLYFNQAELEAIRKAVLVDKYPQYAVNTFNAIKGVQPVNKPSTVETTNFEPNKNYHYNIIVGLTRQNFQATWSYAIEPTQAKGQKLKESLLSWTSRMPGTTYNALNLWMYDVHQGAFMHFALAWMYDLLYPTGLLTDTEKQRLDQWFSEVAILAQSDWDKFVSHRNDYPDLYAVTYEGSRRESYFNKSAFDMGGAVVCALVSHNQAAVNSTIQSGISDNNFLITTSSNQYRDLKNYIAGSIFSDGYTYDGFHRYYGFDPVAGYKGENAGQGQQYHFFMLMPLALAAEAATHNGFNAWEYKDKALLKAYVKGYPWAGSAWRDSKSGSADYNHLPFYWLLYRRFPTNSTIKSAVQQSGATSDSYPYAITNTEELWGVLGDLTVSGTTPPPTQDPPTQDPPPVQDPVTPPTQDPPPATVPQAPYNRSTPWEVPGKVEAEDYDLGGQGISYSDKSTDNEWDAYRADGVDIISNASASNQNMVILFQRTEWMEYTVTSTTAASYNLKAKLGTVATTGLVKVYINDQLVGTLQVPQMAGWRQVVITDPLTIQLPQGQSVIKIEADASNFIDFDYFEITSNQVTTPPPAAITQSAYNRTSSWPIGEIEAENFDEGGQDVAYSDADNVNQYGQIYRTEGVDVRQLNSGYVVGYIQPGEWLEYTVNVPSDGNYRFFTDAATTYSNRSFSILLNGTVKGNIQVPVTGSWNTFERAYSQYTNLTAGDYVLRIQTDSAEAWFDLDKIGIEKQATSTPVTSEACKADINKDGNVNLVDFALFATYWNKQLPDCSMDIAPSLKSCWIDLADFAVFAKHYGKQNVCQSN